MKKPKTVLHSQVCIPPSVRPRGHLSLGIPCWVSQEMGAHGGMGTQQLKSFWEGKAFLLPT